MSETSTGKGFFSRLLKRAKTDERNKATARESRSESENPVRSGTCNSHQTHPEVDARKVTEYFSRVLKRGKLDEVTFRDSVFVATPQEQLRTGFMTPEDAAILFDAHDEATGTSEDPPISVVVSLVSLHQGATSHSGLLLIAAKLFRDGRLEPELETANSPWIPSDRLVSPAVSNRQVMVGSLADFWKYSRAELNAQISQTESFADAIELATRLFKKVAGVTVEDFAEQHQNDGETVEYIQCYVQEFDRIDAVGGLLEVYDYLSREKVPALVKQMCTGWQSPRLHERTIDRAEGLYATAKQSCGSMSEEFPLTVSQRRAVYAYLNGTDGEVTAVSGPPGTGKTTMLQSVVANLVTRNALERADAPIIVGTSTNNQAVTNIISSFGSVAKDEPGPLDFRWLPQEEDGYASADTSLRSLAVYCPSKAKLSQARKKYLVEQTRKNHTYTVYSEEKYLKGAKDRFVTSAHAYFGHSADIAELQQLIHGTLLELDKYRIKLLETMESQGRSSGYLDLCAKVEASEYLRSTDKVTDLKDCTSLEELDQKLDVTLRYAQFWLAVHYYEAQWLLNEDFIEPDDRWKNTPGVMRRYWKQAAALTPCFVMTAYQVPKYFRLYTKGGEPTNFDIGRIDLLIVDEAGQVDTPIGLPSFALATRALVVGDEKQLAPVWSIDEQTDQEVAETVGIEPDVWTMQLHDRGMACSAQSSLMRAASHASPWSYGNGNPGLFLAEHFRCHPEIIGFCNALLYDDLLEPKRPANASTLDAMTPAFLFHEVPGSQDSRQGSSRTNQVEAEALANWIVQNYARFFEIYHSQVSNPNEKVAADELIGVVTPFSAQSRLISQELRKAASSAPATASLPSRLWEKITVGTAHRLQGAERPIVLFSAAYGQNTDQASFIDANPELINVAVSRAKDLFIVFAAKNRWGNGHVFSVMAGFAQRSDAHFTERTTHETATEQEKPEPVRPMSVKEPATEVPATLLSANVPVPEPSEPAATVSVMLKRWREELVLREQDMDLNARDFNTRLNEAGILEGAPGKWIPSKLAGVLGVVVEQRRNAKGEEYTTIEYTPPMQGILLGLYRDGKL